MQQLTPVVKHLIIINILFFVGSSLVGNQAYDMLSLWFPENENFRVWQIFTHMFMHHPTFIFHIFFNMLALWMFGTPLEQMWGKNKFLFFYFSAGIGAVILPYIIDYYQFNNTINDLISNGFNKDEIFELINQRMYDKRWITALGEERIKNFNQIAGGTSLGASGAIMGLLAAFGLNFPNAKLALIFLPIPIAAKYFIPILLGYEILSGAFNWPSMFGINVGHFAHVGGALIGFIIAWYWKKNQFRIN
ncbi:membrane associated rhomboid family serine protease [Tenacibaculum skagerrakense]|uniref:Membrane associated rhomboid family serine protease n=1 Tax=Tenacibaculum skagerrakense TaxID=186571 RepID=A0A4R2NQX0_9FLAO|nr:rhomboid family intramembrane serine protease [Tenacibaculum skagerrakense]TCP24273.1 membrane associated rhomboid family serine protease [Tenacibaculum skagerrakense]